MGVDEELEQIVPPSGNYGGYTETIVGRIINDSSLTNITCEETSSSGVIFPNADDTITGWDFDGDYAFDEIEEPIANFDSDGISTAVGGPAIFTLTNWATITPSADYNYHIYQIKVDYRARSGGNRSVIANIYDGTQWLTAVTQNDLSTWWNYSATWSGLNLTQDDIDNLKVSVQDPGATGEGTRLYIDCINVTVYYKYYPNLGKGTVIGSYDIGANKPIKDLLDMLCLAELFTWYIDPDLELQFNNATTASGISLVATDKMKNIIGERQTKAYTKVVLYGSYAGGAQFTATKGEGDIIWRDSYLNIDTQEALDALAQTILDEQGSDSIKVQLMRYVIADGIYQVGETIAVADAAGIKFSDSNREIPDDRTYIINKIDYYIINGIYSYLDIELIDGLLFLIPKDDKLATTTYNTTENTVAVGQVAGGESVGQANVGSNIGTDGVGVYDSKSGVTLRFRNIAPASAKVTVTENGDDIDIDITEAELSHNSLGGKNAGDDYEHITQAQKDALHSVLTNLNQLATRSHTDLQDVGANDHHTATVAGDLNHNDLANLNAGDVYEHISAAQLAALHDKYTDAEVNALITAAIVGGQAIDNAIDALIAAHAGDDDAHHAKYTDAEALAQAQTRISDAVYDAAGWDGVTTIAPSKNAVRDVIETLATALTYKGTWSPNGYPADPDVGDYWIVDTDGYKAADAPTPERWYEVGDWIVWNGTIWNQLRNSFGDTVLVVAAGDNIQLAIDETIINGSGTIRLLPGTHPITTGLVIDDEDVHIIFEGSGDSSILDVAGSIVGLTITNCKSCVVRNLAIDVISYTVHGTIAILVDETNDNPITIQNITIIGSGDPYYNGVGVFPYSNNVLITECRFIDIWTGVGDTNRAAGDYELITNNYFKCTYGVGLSSISNNNIVTNNVFDDGGILMWGNHNIIQGNVIDGGLRGIIISRGIRNIIDGNIICNTSDNLAGHTGGITLQGTGGDCDYNLISNNIIYNNVNAHASYVCYGIYILDADCANNTLVANVIYGNEGANISDSGTGTVIFGDERYYTKAEVNALLLAYDKIIYPEYFLAANGYEIYSNIGACWRVLMSDTSADAYCSFFVKKGGTFRVIGIFGQTDSNVGKTAGGTIYIGEAQNGESNGWNIVAGGDYNVSLTATAGAILIRGLTTDIVVDDNTHVGFLNRKDDNAGGATGYLYLFGYILERQ